MFLKDFPVLKNIQNIFFYLTLHTRVIKKGDWNEVTRVRKKKESLLWKESMGLIVISRHKENLEAEKSSL